MAKDDIVSVTIRPPSDDEQDVITRVEEQESQSIDNLEAGARQIITLTTTFFGFLFGVIALGSDKFEASLNTTWVAVLGWFAVGLLLAGLLAALMVVWPHRYTYQENRLDQMKTVYRHIIATKTWWLQWALGLFGAGLVAFAGLILLMLMARR